MGDKGGTIQTAELWELVESSQGRPQAERSVQVFDATVLFQQTEKGLTAVPDRKAFDQGHIPGARFVDHFADLSDLSAPHGFALLEPEPLQASLRKLGLSDGKPVVIYSTQHMMWATRFWWILHSCGVSGMRILDGGLKAWVEAGLPLSSDPEDTEAAEGDISVRFNSECWATKEEVQRSIGDGSVCTINALSASSHQGTSKTHYGRPGHIPGSVNVPYGAMAAEASLESDSTLRSLLDEAGAIEKERVVTYCGGGIAATLTAFVLHQQGHSNVGVYDGSLSEWTADASLPMEEGK